MTEDVFVIVESLVKTQCKGKCLKTFPFFLCIFLLISFICFFPILNVSPWVLCGLVKIAEILIKELEIRFSNIVS